MAAPAAGNQMDVDNEEDEVPSSSTSKTGEKKRFEVKKVSYNEIIIFDKVSINFTNEHI